MKQEVIKCDGCGKIIDGVEKRYHVARIILETPEFTDAAGDTDFNQIVSDLCPGCARQIAKIIMNKGAKDKFSGIEEV